jgi:hypothetical protein
VLIKAFLIGLNLIATLIAFIGIMLSVKNHVLHVLSDSTAETRIMIPEKQTLEEVADSDEYFPKRPQKA